MIKITGTLHEDQYTVFIIPRSIFLRMRNVSEEICRENQNERNMFSNVFWKSCSLWDNVGKHCISRADHRRPYGACALHAGHLRLQTLRIC